MRKEVFRVCLLLLARRGGRAPFASAVVYDTCGDGACSSFEECTSCPEDCGYSCQPAYCGDWICQSSESCSICPADCGECTENRSVVVYGAGGTAKRYWADYAANAILRSNLDGSEVEWVRAVNGPYGIGYDPATGNLIWTSSTDEVVQMAPPDGGTAAVNLRSAFGENSAIVVTEGDLQHAYGLDGSQVVRITQNRNTDEEQRAVLVQLYSPEDVVGLALSADGATLYLGDTVGRMSEKLSLATGSVQPLDYQEGGPPPPPMAALASPARQSPVCRKPAFLEVGR
jgi:hypothetical protein